MINIFEYQDYRAYLRDYYTQQKALKRNFSYKAFSEKAGIKAPSFLFYVIEGKRNLTKSSLIKISQALSHSRDDADYFESLVFFNQALTITEKTHHYSRLVEIRKPIDIGTIAADRYTYYSNWYHSVIREVVTFFDFKGDFSKLAAYLVPSISAKEARESIVLLERLGFIELDHQGLYHQTENLLFSKDDMTTRFILEKFQSEMLIVALKSYDVIHVKDRMSSTTTFSISRETFELFKLRLREMQRQLMEMARMDTKPSQAYQMNLNIFPVSKETSHEN